MHVEGANLVFDEVHGDSRRALLYPDLSAWTIVFIDSEGATSVEILLQDEVEEFLPGDGADIHDVIVRLVEAALHVSGYRPAAGILEPDALASWSLLPTP